MSHRRNARSPAEDGFNLIEVVLTIALMSIAFIAILSAVGTMITAGAAGRATSTAETAVRNLGEWIQRQPYQKCHVAGGPLAMYQAEAGAPMPAGFTGSVIAVQAWNGDGGDTAHPLTTTNNACGPNSSTDCVVGGCDQGIEFVTVQVKSPPNLPGGASLVTRTLTVASRRSS